MAELKLQLAFIKIKVRIIEAKWKISAAEAYKKFKWHFSFDQTILIMEIHFNLNHANLKCKEHD